MQADHDTTPDHWHLDVLDGTARLTLVGELDELDRGALLRDVAGLGGTRLVVDLSRVTFLGSGGLSTLLAVRSSVRDADGSVELEGVSPAHSRVFRLTGLEELLDGPDPSRTEVAAAD